jgi:hypothetical protein
MAGDWIKIEMSTPDKPEVIAIAAALRIDQDAVTGKLLRIWIWADMNSVDGADMSISDAFIDRLTNKRGFAAAMRRAGWLTGVDGMLSFPGFGRHNGVTAKARAETNRRVANHRERNKNVTPDALQKPLPEKRREDKNTPQPPCRGGERGGELVERVKGLRPKWAAVALLSAGEERVFRRNRPVLEALTLEDWALLREFLAARIPEGSAWFQPRLLAKFLENPGAALGDAREWKSKQRPALKVVPAPVPVARSEEDAAALAEFLKQKTR